MRTIWKYPLSNTMAQDVVLPYGAQILTAQVQRGAIVLWATFDKRDGQLQVKRQIRFILTGDEVPREIPLQYISTLQIDDIVIHVFEANPPLTVMKNLRV